MKNLLEKYDNIKQKLHISSERRRVKIKQHSICVILLLILTACQFYPTTQSHSTNSQQQHKQQDQQVDQTEALLKDVLEKAKNGKMYGVEQFPIGTPVQTVLKRWGTPEAGDPGYLDYKNGHQCGLMSSNTKSVTGIMSYHQQLLQLKVDDIQKYLGKPKKQKQDNFSSYQTLSYQAGKYELTFFYQGKRIEYVYVGEKL